MEDKKILNEIHKELNNPDIENYIIGKNGDDTFGNIIKKTKQIEKSFLSYKLNEDLFNFLNLDEIIKEPLLQNEKISLDNEQLISEKPLISQNQKINFLDQDMKNILDSLDEICNVDLKMDNIEVQLVDPIIYFNNENELNDDSKNIIINNETRFNLYENNNDQNLNSDKELTLRETIFEKRKTIYEKEYIKKISSLKNKEDSQSENLSEDIINENNKKENLSPINYINMLESINEKNNEKEIDLNDYYSLEIYKSKNELNIDILKSIPNDNLFNSINKIKEKFNCFIVNKLNTLIYIGSSEGNLYKFEILTGELKETINTKESEILSLSLYNNYLVTGHKNGIILILQDNKIIDTIKEKSSIIFVDFLKINLTKKKFELITSDLEGNVKLIIRAKSFFLNRNITETIFESKKTPIYNIIINNKEEDLSKTKKKNMIFAFCSIFNVTLKKISRNQKKVEEKFQIFPSDNNLEGEIPDCCFGKGFILLDKINKDSFKELNLFLVSWGKEISIYSTLNDEKSLKDYQFIHKYVNDTQIIKVGYLSNSFIYIIDLKFNLKILTTYNLNDNTYEINEQIKFNVITIKNLDLKSNGYLYYIINDIKTNTIFYSKNILSYDKGLIIIGNKGINLFELLNWEDILNSFCEKKEFEKMFCLGYIIFNDSSIISKINGNYLEKYKDKLSFGLIHKYYSQMIETENKNNIIKAIKICIEFCIKSNLINTLIDFFHIIKYSKNEETFFELFTDYIMNGDLINISEIDENFLKKYIEYYINKKEKLKLSSILLKFNTLVLIKYDILELITKNDLLNPYIYICMNAKLVEFDYYKPIIYMFGIFEEKYENCNYSTFIIFHNEKFYNEELLSCKQYFKHKLFWYMDLCLKGIKYPSLKSIEKENHENIVKKISLFLINEKTLDSLLLFDSFTYFSIFSQLYFNNNLYTIINSDYPEDIIYSVGLVNLKKNKITPKYLIYKLTNYIKKIENENFYIKKDFFDFIGNICKNKEINFNLDKELLFEAASFLINYNSQKSYTKDKDNFQCHAIEGINNYNEELEKQEEIIFSILKNIKESGLFFPEDSENLLKLIIHTSYTKIQLFLLKEAKHYEEYLISEINYFKELNLKDIKSENLDIQIEKFFRWIEKSLIETSKMSDQNKFINLKKIISQNLQNLCEISVNEFSVIVNSWFKNSQEEVIKQLENSPNFQNVYIDKYIESHLKMDENIENLKKFILKKIKLLIKINHKDGILEILKRFNFVCDLSLLNFLKQEKIYDGTIYICQVLGDVDEGLKITIDIIQKNFKEIISNLNSEKFNSNIINNYRDIHLKFLLLGIQLCRSNSSNNNKEENNEIDEFWLKFLNSLYQLRTSFKPLFKENQNNEKTYDYNIVNQDLEESINLIIGAMTEYVKIPLLIDIVSIKCKDAGFKEFSKIIENMFFSYSRTEFIFKYAHLCIKKSTLNNFFQLISENKKAFYFDNFICDFCHKEIANESIILFKCKHNFHFDCCLKKNNNFYCNLCFDDNDKIENIHFNSKIEINEEEKKNIAQKIKRKKNLDNLTKINSKIFQDLTDFEYI